MDQSDQEWFLESFPKRKSQLVDEKNAQHLIHFMSIIMINNKTDVNNNAGESLKQFPLWKETTPQACDLRTGNLPSLELTVRPLQNGGRETAVLLGIAPIFMGNLLVSGSVLTLTFTKRL